jgi:NTE family protein
VEKATAVLKKSWVFAKDCLLELFGLQYLYSEDTVKRMKKVCCLLLLLGLGCSFLFAEVSVPLPSNAAGDILTADIPIQYGDANFRQRILDRTHGERSPLGLVLSGGSARAFAHIGVLKYLEEQGIVPDFIISNSMGSIVGLMYAAGMSADQILEAISNVSLQTLFDLTFPLGGGLLDSSRFVAKLASILGPDLQLENLQIPIMVVTEDLATKRQVQISEGDFYTVLTAAYALPVYFPPVEFNGHLLIDGGITNIVPLDLAYVYADSVIVSTTFYDVDTLNLRNALTLLNVSIDISKRRRGVEELKKHLDDVIWIRCGVENVSFMDFGAVKELAQKGYDSAKLQKEKLENLYKAMETPDETEILRQADMSNKIEAEENTYQLYSHIKQYSFSQILGLGFESDFVIEDTSFLKDDNTAGVKYTLRSGDLVFSTNAGMAFQSNSDSRFTFNPTVNAKVDYFLFDHFKASLGANALFDLPTNSPVLYATENLEGRFLFHDDQLRISLLQGLETISNPENADSAEYWDGSRYLFNSGVESLLTLQQNPGWNIADIELGLFYQILGDFEQFRSFVAVHSTIGVEETRTGIYADLSTSLRFALDGNGDVPYFLSDQFRTNNSVIRSQGHDLTVSTNATNYLVSAGLLVGYRPISFLPSFAELFILENSSIATYFDFLWYEKSEGWLPSMSLGLELHTDISLLGIRKLPLTVYGGWDQSVESIVWGFSFNITF